MFRKIKDSDTETRVRALSLDKTVDDIRGSGSKSPRRERKRLEKGSGITTEQLIDVVSKYNPHIEIKTFIPDAIKMLRTAEYPIFEQFILGWDVPSEMGPKLASIVQLGTKLATPYKIIQIVPGETASGLQELVKHSATKLPVEFVRIFDVLAYCYFFLFMQNTLRINRAYNPIKVSVSGIKPPGSSKKATDFIYDICVYATKNSQINMTLITERVSNLMQQLTVQDVFKCIDIKHVYKTEMTRGVEVQVMNHIEFTLNHTSGDESTD